MAQTPLALTRTTLPASCTDTVNAHILDTRTTNLWVGWVDDNKAPARIQTEGYPSSYNRSSWYSPGVCPYQWTECQSTAAPSSPTVLGFAPHESAAFCCPTGYTCGLATTSWWPQRVWCASSLSTSKLGIVYASTGAEALSTPTTTWFSEHTIRANAIQIRWSRGDPGHDEDHGLGKSSVIAIAITVPLVVLALLISGIVCMLHKRKRKLGMIKTSSDDRDDLPEPIGNLQELRTLHEADSHDINELPPSSQPQRIELGQSGQRSEHLGGIEVVHELPGKELRSSAPGVVIPPSNQHSDSEKEVSRDAEGLVPLDDPDRSARHTSEKVAIEQELQSLRQERETLYMDQLARRQKELEERLHGLH